MLDGRLALRPCNKCMMVSYLPRILPVYLKKEQPHMFGKCCYAAFLSLCSLCGKHGNLFSFLAGKESLTVSYKPRVQDSYCLSVEFYTFCKSLESYSCCLLRPERTRKSIAETLSSLQSKQAELCDLQGLDDLHDAFGSSKAFKDQGKMKLKSLKSEASQSE